MDELRFVRREDQALIVANDADQEFRLVVDDAVLSELKALSRRDRAAVGKVRPREIQSLIRAGKSRAEVMAQTGLEEADIERYEEPVLAERRYILERAQAVPVRAEAHADAEQRFGSVIQERLLSLSAEASEWASWRDEETGWMVSLEFISRDVAHRAVWAFDHRKGALSPVSPDAVTLSKQGEVGDRLIPKLRAVDTDAGSGRFDSGAFDPDALAPHSPAEADSATAGTAAVTDGAAAPEDADGNAAEPESPDADYARRREIDQRAIKTSETLPVDLSQTADLLDALRRRRGERDQEHRAATLADLAAEAAEGQTEHPESVPVTLPEPPADAPEAPAGARARSIWGASGVSGSAPPLGTRSADRDPRPSTNTAGQDASASDAEDNDTAPLPGPRTPAAPTFQTSPPAAPAEPAASEPAEKPAKKGRASIPSWDDILFGTRSDDDPS